MEVFRDKIEALYHFKKGSHIVKVCVILVYTITVLILCLFLYKFNINLAVGLGSVILIYIILCEYKMHSNLHFCNIKMNIDTAERLVKHGDYVLFRSYENYDIPELLLYRHLNAIFHDVLFGHIGIVLEINGKKYVLESTEDEYYSELVGYKKNGVHLMRFSSRVSAYHGRVHVVPTNLNQYMRNNQNVWNFIMKNKHESFLTHNGGVSCLLLIRNLLNEFNLLKRPGAFPLGPTFFLKSKNYLVNLQTHKPVMINNLYINKLYNE